MSTRITDQTAREILVALAYLSFSGYSLRDCWSVVAGSRVPVGDISGGFAEAQRWTLRNQRPGQDLSGIMTNLMRALGTPDEPSKETPMLIELIAETLQAAYARNAISGNVLEAMRRVVLRPDELVKLKEAILKHEMRCAQCGQELHEGQAVTFSLGRGDRHQMHQPAIFCYTCVPPTILACATCGKPTEVGNRELKTLLVQCDEHEKKRTTKGKENPPDLTAEQVQAMRRETQEWAARMGNRPRPTVTTANAGIQWGPEPQVNVNPAPVPRGRPTFVPVAPPTTPNPQDTIRDENPFFFTTETIEPVREGGG